MFVFKNETKIFCFMDKCCNSKEILKFELNRYLKLPQKVDEGIDCFYINLAW